jgi:glutamine synthetase
VRIPSVDQANRSGTTRVEFKPADNTTNPYLALLGLLGAGMDGVERELEPGEPLNQDPGNLDDDELAARDIERLPTTLEEALDALEDDDTLRETMGEDLFESYVEVKRSEWDQSTDEEGDWESEYLARGF